MSSLDSLLQTTKEVEYFTLDGLETTAKVVDCYDGDTLTVVFWLFDKYSKFRIRLDGIDCAEKRSKDPVEVACSLRGLDYVHRFIGDQKLVHLKCKGWDKYGRLLTDVYDYTTKSQCLNDLLVEERLACRYTGGTKTPFQKWFQQ